MLCMGCAEHTEAPKAAGEIKLCRCGWSHLRNEDGSVAGRSPEAGPHTDLDQTAVISESESLEAFSVRDPRDVATDRGK